MAITFNRALPCESPIISDIAIRSKAHWGYAAEQLQSWRDGLRIKEAYIQKNLVYNMQHGGRTIGFFSVVKGSPHCLDHLWILPEFIGRGYGKQAIEFIKGLCIQNAIAELFLLSDPHAEGFYLRQGASRSGEVFSEAQSKMLPQLTLTIHPTHKPENP